jgi:hypothetical protein
MAQDAALIDQLGAARQAFMSGQTNDTLMDGGYYQAVTTDLAGSWIEAALFDQAEPAKLAEYISGSCERFPTAIVASDLFTLTMTLVARNISVATNYVYVGGTSFVAQTDVREQLTRLGIIDRLATNLQGALFSLAAGNGVVDVYRPSADTIVITANRSPPRILLRCSPTTPAIPGGGDRPDETALRDAIGNAFDDQFGSDADPAKRQAFIDCATPVFSPLTAEDRRLVVETNFNPPEDQRERIEVAYPGLAPGAMACAEAVEKDGLP